MKCDDFVACHQTGGVVRRAAAHLHAVRCRRCAALREGLRAMERELARTEPLTPAQRRLWEQAADTAPAGTPSRFVRGTGLAIAAAVSVAILLGVAWLLRDRAPGLTSRPEIVKQTEPGQAEPRQAPAARVRVERPPPAVEGLSQAEVNRSLQGLAAMERDLDRLAAQLDEMARRAGLLSVRQEVEAMARTYKEITPQKENRERPGSGAGRPGKAIQGGWAGAHSERTERTSEARS